MLDLILMRRGFLTETEIDGLEKFYPNLKILRLYSIENYLLHPDNLQEYFNEQQKSFDKVAYIQALVEAKNAVKDNFVYSLVPNRMSYPFYREMSHKAPKWFKNTSENQAAAKEIYQSLTSDKLADFYPFFPMKDYGKTIPQRQNLQYSELSSTLWFKKQITEIISK
ncbi:MAG: hypothetical protein AB8G86_25350 [Saprospiraceae bacterium]